VVPYQGTSASPSGTEGAVEVQINGNWFEALHKALHIFAVGVEKATLLA
jgi:hypothetical protein